MAVPILIMEFLMHEGSRIEVSLLLQLEERIMAKGNIVPLQGLRVFPKVFLSWLIF